MDVIGKINNPNGKDRVTRKTNIENFGFAHSWFSCILGLWWQRLEVGIVVADFNNFILDISLFL
jgi:hypothetical protein